MRFLYLAIFAAFIYASAWAQVDTSQLADFVLPEEGFVRIDIYDLLGRRIKTLIDKEMQAGRHRIVWGASSYSSGVYFCSIKAGDFVDTIRMLYLR